MDSEEQLARLNIMVVEDDSNLRESMVDALTMSGHQVASVDCAESLSEQTDLLQLDLIIIDLNLPGENGLSLSKRLRETQPDLGIIILTARDLNDDRKDGYASGADVFLTKPASLAELNEVIKSLSRRLNKLPPTDQDKSVYLDAKGLSFSYQGAATSLTQNETRLLLAFARANQLTLETWQIAEALSLEGDINKPLIELRVARLRKKLPRVTGTSIRSIRGVGYQLCIPLKLL